jgi:predicted secreted protein
MGYVKGDYIRFYNAGVQLTLEMEVSISATLDTIETVDKDSAAWKTFIAGDKSWTVSGSANLDWAAAENITQTYADFVAGAAVAIDVGSANDTTFYSGNGIFTSFGFDAARNALATFTFEVQGSGALTEGSST